MVRRETIEIGQWAHRSLSTSCSRLVHLSKEVVEVEHVWLLPELVVAELASLLLRERVVFILVRLLLFTVILNVGNLGAITLLCVGVILLRRTIEAFLA